MYLGVSFDLRGDLFVNKIKILMIFKAPLHLKKTLCLKANKC